jgi:hypothetical protein
VFSAQIFKENTFLEIKPNFPLTVKCFSLINFSNGKQSQESLESGFPETTFQETNMVFIKLFVIDYEGNCVCFLKCFLFENILK